MDTATDSVVEQRRESLSNTGGVCQDCRKVTFFKEDDSGQTTWYDFETSVAVAAAAYAVHSLDVADTDLRNGTNERSRKSDDQLVPFPRSITDEIEAKNSRQKSMKKPCSEAPMSNKPSKISSPSFRSSSSIVSTDAKIDTWERNEVEKIKNRYAKLRSSIQSWEDDKKTKAKIELQKKKIESERKRERNQQQYRFKMEHINGIGKGGRAEMLKKMKKEETAVKDRAMKIRSGRGGAAYFLCF